MSKYRIIVLLVWQPVAAAPTHLEFTLFVHLILSFVLQLCFEKHVDTKFHKLKKNVMIH